MEKAIKDELEAETKCAEVLAPLTLAAQRRIIAWLRDVFVESKFTCLRELQDDYKKLRESHDRTLERIKKIEKGKT